LASAAQLMLGATGPARAAAEEALVAAQAARDPLRAVDAQLAVALAAAQAGGTGDAETALAQAAAGAERLHAAERQARALLDLAALARRQGDAAAAAQWTSRWADLVAARARPEPPR
jgi:hypothetical protein